MVVEVDNLGQLDNVAWTMPDSSSKLSTSTTICVSKILLSISIPSKR